MVSHVLPLFKDLCNLLPPKYKSIKLGETLINSKPNKGTNDYYLQKFK